MARFAFTLATLGLLAACTQEVDDPSFNTAGNDAAGDSSSSGGGESGGGTSSTSQGSSASNTSTSATGADESTSGGSSMSTTAGDSSGASMSTSATTGASGCGDGMISPGEQCDGADLQGFDCTSLGLSGGTLSCDPVTCTFDTSMCMATTSGTSG